VRGCCTVVVLVLYKNQIPFITEDAEEYPFHKLVIVVKFTPETRKQVSNVCKVNPVCLENIWVVDFFFFFNSNKKLFMKYKVERNFDLFFIKKMNKKVFRSN
jgi:hypothetical protein